MARFLIIICLLFPFFALAEEGAKSWQMEDADSTIKFSVVIEGGPSEGEFTKFTADIQFDREKLDQSHLDIIIDLSQIDSFYDDVSTNLVKKDWFDVVRFPTENFMVLSASWQMEDADSTIKFSVVIEGGPSEGEFTKFTADIQFDREKLDQSHLDIIIDLSQIDSFYDDVSTNLVKKDWFDVVRFPTGRFVSREFKHIDSNNYQVTGDMTLRDVTKSETLHFALTEYGEHQASIIGKMTLNRLDYGVGQGVWSDITSVGGKVFLSVVVKATR